MENQGDLVRRRFDFMNASKSAHELLEWKRPAVFSYGHDLRVENERIPLKISERNLDDFRNAPGDFRKTPAPDADLFPVFMNLNPGPVVLVLQRCLSAMCGKDRVEVL